MLCDVSLISTLVFGYSQREGVDLIAQAFPGCNQHSHAFGILREGDAFRLALLPVDGVGMFGISGENEVWSTFVITKAVCWFDDEELALDYLIACYPDFAPLLGEYEQFKADCALDLEECEEVAKQAKAEFKAWKRRNALKILTLKTTIAVLRIRVFFARLINGKW